MTGEAYYGKLEGGLSGNCSLNLARQLLDDNCDILKALSRRIPFEIAVGIKWAFLGLRAEEQSIHFDL